MSKPGNQLKQIQKQAISPLQKLSGELLELPIDQLNERIEKEKENNPYLEEIEEKRNNYYYSNNSEPVHIHTTTIQDQPYLNTASIETLTEDLLNQLRLSNISPQQYKIGESIIGNLDEKGYLNRSLTAIADDIYFDTYEEINISEIEKVLKLIQNFEPAGIAARNHQECLQLQLQRKDQQDPIVQLAQQIIEHLWEHFFNKKLQIISKTLHHTQEEIDQAYHLIQTLNISPGYDTTVEKEQYINPDITIWNDKGHIKYKLNKESNKKLNINQDSIQLLEQLEKNNKNEETIKFLKDKINSAKLFIEAYNNRNKTLHHFIQELIKYQEDYFQEGDVMKLRPMKYEDMKNLTGFSESSISRIANDKYLQTHFGTFKIKKLFTKSIESQTGDQISTDSIRNILIELTTNEDKQKPYTDQELLDKLEEQGITLSRRTITKYRQQIGIETASKRKQK